MSERRVQDVAQYLVNNGVDANRLIGIANGDAKPVATNATANGKAENRRVTFSFTANLSFLNLI